MKPKYIEKISKIIKDFLIEHGGYTNGYETYVRGTVRSDVFKNLEWETPDSFDLTRRQINRFGSELNELIMKELPRGIEISIEPVYLSDGCYSTYIKPYTTYKVDLW